MHWTFVMFSCDFEGYGHGEMTRGSLEDLNSVDKDPPWTCFPELDQLDPFDYFAGVTSPIVTSSNVTSRGSSSNEVRLKITSLDRLVYLFNVFIQWHKSRVKITFVLKIVNIWLNKC